MYVCELSHNYGRYSTTLAPVLYVSPSSNKPTTVHREIFRFPW